MATILTIPTAAAMIGVHPRTLHFAIARGELAATTSGRISLVAEADIRRWHSKAPERLRKRGRKRKK